MPRPGRLQGAPPPILSHAERRVDGLDAPRRHLCAKAESRADRRDQGMTGTGRHPGATHEIAQVAQSGLANLLWLIERAYAECR